MRTRWVGEMVGVNATVFEHQGGSGWGGYGQGHGAWNKDFDEELRPLRDSELPLSDAERRRERGWKIARKEGRKGEQHRRERRSAKHGAERYRDDGFRKGRHENPRHEDLRHEGYSEGNHETSGHLRRRFEKLAACGTCFAQGARAVGFAIGLMLIFDGIYTLYPLSESLLSLPLTILKVYITIFGVFIALIEGKNFLPEHSQVRRLFYTQFNFLTTYRGKGLFYCFVASLALFLGHSRTIFVFPGLALLKLGLSCFFVSFFNVPASNPASNLSDRQNVRDPHDHRIVGQRRLKGDRFERPIRSARPLGPVNKHTPIPTPLATTTPMITTPPTNSGPPTTPALTPDGNRRLYYYSPPESSTRAPTRSPPPSGPKPQNTKSGHPGTSSSALYHYDANRLNAYRPTSYPLPPMSHMSPTAGDHSGLSFGGPHGPRLDYEAGPARHPAIVSAEAQRRAKDIADVRFYPHFPPPPINFTDQPDCYAGNRKLSPTARVVSNLDAVPQFGPSSPHREWSPVGSEYDSASLQPGDRNGVNSMIGDYLEPIIRPL